MLNLIQNVKHFNCFFYINKNIKEYFQSLEYAKKIISITIKNVISILYLFTLNFKCDLTYFDNLLYNNVYLNLKIYLKIIFLDTKRIFQKEIL